MSIDIIWAFLEWVSPSHHGFNIFNILSHGHDLDDLGYPHDFGNHHIYIYTYIHHIAKIPMQRTSARPHALAAGTSHPTPQGRHWLRKKPAHIHQKPMLDMSQS